MSEVKAFKPKKSVALSGTTAGNTAVCTVGRTGNDLHYRGYDILDIAETCEFEEVAYLIIHEKLPNQADRALKQAIPDSATRLFLLQNLRRQTGGNRGGIDL